MSFLDSADDPKKAQRRPLYGFLLVTLAVGAVGSLFTTSQIPTWYAGLNRPSIAPPNWVFAPMWFTLYVLIGIAGLMAGGGVICGLLLHRTPGREPAGELAPA